MKRLLFVVLLATLSCAWGQIMHPPHGPMDDGWTNPGFERLAAQFDSIEAQLAVLTRKVTKLQRSVDSLTVLVDERTKLPNSIFDLRQYERMPDAIEMLEHFESRGWSMP